LAVGIVGVMEGFGKFYGVLGMEVEAPPAEARLSYKGVKVGRGGASDDHPWMGKVKPIAFSEERP
jgi:hypothetical protein